MSRVSDFINDNYRVLSCLYDNMNADEQIKITQQEAADLLGMTRITANKYFQQLKEQGYLTHDTKRVGRYYLTESGMNVIKTFRKIEK